MIEEILEKSDDLIDGLEKKIVWYTAAGTKTACSVVYMHGFGAGHKEMSGVPEQVAAGLHANLFLMRLSGHGTKNTEHLRTVSYKEWLADADEAVKKGEQLGNEVIVIAHSLSALIMTAYLLQNRGTRVKTLICTSPNLTLKSFFAPLAASRYGRFFIKLLFGKYRILNAENELVRKYWMIKQPSEAVAEIAKLAHILKKNAHNEFPCALTFIYNPTDRIIDLTYMKNFMYNLKSKHTKILYSYSKGSRHTFAGNILAPENTKDLAGKILTILQNV